MCGNMAGVSEELGLTRHSLDCNSEEAHHFSQRVDNGHSMDQRNRVQQVTQVNRSPEEEPAWSQIKQVSS